MRLDFNQFFAVLSVEVLQVPQSVRPPLVFFTGRLDGRPTASREGFTRSRATADAFCNALREREAKGKNKCLNSHTFQHRTR
jgi:hypothetical protein